MKLDSHILYSEAQRAVKTPQFKYLMVGLACGAMMPTIYARHYRLPAQQQQQQRIMLLPKQSEEKKPAKLHRLSAMGDVDEENTYMLISSIL